MSRSTRMSPHVIDRSPGDECRLLGVSYELTGSPPTYERMREPEYAAEAMKLQYVSRRLTNSHVNLYSAEGRGPQRLGITSFAFFPLSAATSEASVLIDGVSADLKASGPLPPGLQDQLDLQIACLRDDSAPDLELIAWPGFATA